MKYLRLFPLLVALVIAVGGFFPQAQAFNASLSPAKKIYYAERGEVIEYVITYTNNAETEGQDFVVSVGDFFYGDGGTLTFVNDEDIADKAESLTTWIEVPEEVVAPAGEPAKVSVKIRVPDTAAYGDHMGAIFIEAAEKGAGGVVAIKGRLASLVIVKVLGGEEIRKRGAATDFDIQTRERARNTATFEYLFKNLGRDFFDLQTKIEVFEQEGDEVPVKTLTNITQVFPNAERRIRVPLGDLGDDFGEQEYFVKVLAAERSDSEERVIFGQFEESFFYFVPVREVAADSGARTVIEREVVKSPPIVEIVKELGLYIGGFILVLLVFIRVLFFSGSSASNGKKKR